MPDALAVTTSHHHHHHHHGEDGSRPERPLYPRNRVSFKNLVLNVPVTRGQNSTVAIVLSYMSDGCVPALIIHYLRSGKSKQAGLYRCKQVDR